MGRPRDPKVEGVVGHRKFETDFRETSRDGRFFADTFWGRSLMLKKVLLCGTWKVICNVVRWSGTVARLLLFRGCVTSTAAVCPQFCQCEDGRAKRSGVFFR